MRRCGIAYAAISVLMAVAAMAVLAGTGENGSRAVDTHAALVKRLQDHKKIDTESCGLLREILGMEDKLPLTLVIAEDIKPTKGHYHLNFKEIYFVLDGWMKLRFYDPDANRYWEEKILANELCIIDKNIHHVIVEASPKNRLCVIAVPGYSDETLSDKL